MLLLSHPIDCGWLRLVSFTGPSDSGISERKMRELGAEGQCFLEGNNISVVN